MRVYRKKLVSTQDGNCKALECSAVIACKGLGVVVDTAKITIENFEHVQWNQDNDVQATGWFHASDFEGTKSPSAQRRSSSHHGVRKPSLSTSLSIS
jgi:hypothetical protein